MKFSNSLVLGPYEVVAILLIYVFETSVGLDVESHVHVCVRSLIKGWMLEWLRKYDTNLSLDGQSFALIRLVMDYGNGCTPHHQCPYKLDAFW